MSEKILSLKDFEAFCGSMARVVTDNPGTVFRISASKLSIRYSAYCWVAGQEVHTEGSICPNELLKLKMPYREIGARLGIELIKSLAIEIGADSELLTEGKEKQN